jgi:hypothetical protein
MAPATMQSASLDSPEFFAIGICVKSPNPYTTAVSNDCVIHPVASFRVQAPGRAYRSSALHEGGGGLW